MSGVIVGVIVVVVVVHHRLALLKKQRGGVSRGVHDALDELQLRRGDEATAIVKSTEVMVGREESNVSRE